MINIGWHTVYFLDFHPFKKPDYPEVFGTESSEIVGHALALLGDDAETIFDEGVNLLDIIIQKTSDERYERGLSRMVLEAEAEEQNKPELLHTNHTFKYRYFGDSSSNDLDELVIIMNNTDLSSFETNRNWCWSELLAILCVNAVAESANEEGFRLSSTPKKQDCLFDHKWYSNSYDTIGMYCFDAHKVYSYAVLERQKEHFQGHVKELIAEKDKIRFTKAALAGHAKKKAIQDAFIPYALKTESQKATEGKPFVISKTATIFFENLPKEQRQLFSLSNYARTFADHLRKYKRQSEFE